MQWIEKLYKLQQMRKKYIWAFDQNLKQHLILTNTLVTRIKMDSQNMSYKAGQAKGETQVSTKNC